MNPNRLNHSLVPLKVEDPFRSRPKGGRSQVYHYTNPGYRDRGRTETRVDVTKQRPFESETNTGGVRLRGQEIRLLDAPEDTRSVFTRAPALG